MKWFLKLFRKQSNQVADEAAWAASRAKFNKEVNALLLQTGNEIVQERLEKRRREVAMALDARLLELAHGKVGSSETHAQR